MRRIFAALALATGAAWGQSLPAQNARDCWVGEAGKVPIYCIRCRDGLAALCPRGERCSVYLPERR